MNAARIAGALAVATLLAAALGCSNRKTPLPGKSCYLNSDCDDPLSCTFNKCHEACRENGDCPNGGLCVYAPAAPVPSGRADEHARRRSPESVRAGELQDELGLS